MLPKKVGVLNSWDDLSKRWQLGFESFDGHLEVAAEHLQVIEATKTGKTGKAMPRQEWSCEMCLGHFLETQVGGLNMSECFFFFFFVSWGVWGKDQRYNPDI